MNAQQTRQCLLTHFQSVLFRTYGVCQIDRRNLNEYQECDLVALLGACMLN